MASGALPDSFLIPDESSGLFKINQSPIWNSILSDPDWLYYTDNVGRASNNISISSTRFWNLTFSSQANSQVFGDGSPVVEDSRYRDGIVRGAVLGMSPPATEGVDDPRSGRPFKDVAEKFGVTTDTASGLLKPVLELMESKFVQLRLNTTPSTRNAFWAVPGRYYQTVVSLNFELNATGLLLDMQNYINQYFGLSLILSSMKQQVTFKNIRNYVESANDSIIDVASSSTEYNVTLSFATVGFALSILFTPEETKLAFSGFDASPASSIYHQLESAGLTSSSLLESSLALGDQDLPNEERSSPFDQFFSSIALWYLTIGKRDVEESRLESENAPYWQVAVLVDLDIGSQERIASLVYDTRTRLFEGKLLNKKIIPSPRQYDYQTWKAIPDSVAPGSSDLDYSSLLAPGGLRPPPQVPLHVEEASIVYQQSSSGGGYRLAVSSLIDLGPAASADVDRSPPSALNKFTWSSVEINLELQDDDPETSFVIEVSSSFSLTLSDVAGELSPKLQLYLRYESTNDYWVLEARTDDIKIKSLIDFFDDTVASAVQGTIGSVSIKSLSVLHAFDINGNASSFIMSGSLVLGDLELDLSYQYQSNRANARDKTASALFWGDEPPKDPACLPAQVDEPTWVFEAFWGASTQSCSIQSIVSSILPVEGPGVVLPSFIGNIEVKAASSERSPVKLKLLPADLGLLVIIQLAVLDIDITFVSILNDEGSRYLLRIGADKIPLISSIPLFKDLPQPFDELLYMCAGADEGVAFEGFTREDLSVINRELESISIAKIASQQTGNSTGGATEIALQKGHHFMILNDSAIILDHVFNNAVTDSTDLDDNSVVASADTGNSFAVATRSAASTVNESIPTKGAVDVQLPFLSISALTVQFKQGALHLAVDATMRLGPIELTLLGLEIVFKLSEVTLDDLSGMFTGGLITVGLHGLSLDISQSPLHIAGVFMHIADQQSEAYMGGVAVGFEAWQFLAVGAYEIITIGGDNYKSVFIYAKLDGPLITLPYGTISGLRAGFGYNSVVRSPSGNELSRFPFLNGDAESDAGNDPMKVILAMTGNPESGEEAWVSPRENAYWAAVGLTLTAFGALSVTAVLMLGFRDSGVVISVLADGVAQMPPSVPSRYTLFYVQIQMIAELNTIEGYFTVQAALAPSSHMLVPSCRLTGGFALTNWFTPSAHAGDFVFAVGGYHPAYSPPSWYPVPTRVGVSFILDSMISVIGGVYFAITPKCVMAGGNLGMTLSVGPVSAWLDISLDIFAQYKPLFYTAELEISVACSISLEVGFVHAKVNASVGADLYLHGPQPFGGYANVDFYLFSFTIHLGPASWRLQDVDLASFYRMLSTSEPTPSTTSTATPVNATITQLKFVLTSGLCPTFIAAVATSAEFGLFDSNESSTWNVSAGSFSCKIDCDFALTRANLATSNKILPQPPATFQQFYSKPMHADRNSTFDSYLLVGIFQLNSDGKRIPRDGFDMEITTKKVPTALWGAYDAAQDPSRNTQPSELTNQDVNSTMTLCMGVRLTAPLSRKEASFLSSFDPSVAFLHDLGTAFLPKSDPVPRILLSSGIVHKEKDPEQRWKQFRKKWERFAKRGRPLIGGDMTGNGQSPGLLQMAAQNLGWNKRSPAIQTPARLSSSGVGEPAIRPPWALNGEPPKLLMRSLEMQYSILPRYSARWPSSR